MDKGVNIILVALLAALTMVWLQETVPYLSLSKQIYNYQLTGFNGIANFSLIPNQTDMWDLGNSTNMWRNLWLSGTPTLSSYSSCTVKTDGLGTVICGSDLVNDSDADPTNEIQGLDSVLSTSSVANNDIVINDSVSSNRLIFQRYGGNSFRLFASPSGRLVLDHLDNDSKVRNIMSFQPSADRMVLTADVVKFSPGNTPTKIRVANGSLCVDDDGGCNSANAGEVYAVTYNTGHSDIAEMYQVNSTNLDNGKIKPGVVLCMVSGQVLDICAEDYDWRFSGVYSSNPGFIANADCDAVERGFTYWKVDEDGYNGSYTNFTAACEDYVPVGMSGRVDVYVDCNVTGVSEGDILVPQAGTGYARGILQSDVATWSMFELYNHSSAIIGKAIGSCTKGDGIVKMEVWLR